MDHLLAAAIKKLTTKEYFLKAGLLSQQLFFSSFHLRNWM